MKPSILLLTREGLTNNRAVINDLWCDIVPKKGANVFWIPGNNIFEKSNILKGKNLCILTPKKSTKKNIFFQTFDSLLYKFNLSLFLVKKKLVNHAQVRNGIGDGLICLLLKIFYGLTYSFHLSSLHGFADSSIVSSQKGFQKIKYKFRIFFYPFFYRIILSQASMVQPISDYMGNHLSNSIKLDNKKMFPLPISSVRKKINKYDKTLSRNPRVVYAGTLAAERDIDFILKLFSSLSECDKSIRFRIVGIVEKNTDLSLMKERLYELGIFENTELFLNISYNKVLPLISECDIGLSPIKPNEKYKVSTPTKTIEYLSCGLPVVCNDEILDHQFIIDNSKGGLAVPYSVNYFTEAVLSILNDKSLYSKMSNKGKKWLFDNRTYDDLSIRLIENYKKCIMQSVTN